MKDIFYCPRCMSTLIKGKGTKIYETLVEHVCSPNSPVYAKEYYICSNEKCPTLANGYFWDVYGDSYCDKRLEKDIFALETASAINSITRKNDIQGNKKDFTILYLYWFKMYIESTPIPDKMGLKIIGHKRKIRMCVRHDSLSWVMYTPGIHMFRHCFKQFNWALNKFIEDPSNQFAVRELLRGLQPPNWDKRWWRRLSSWIFNKSYPRLKEQLLCLKNKSQSSSY